jgi:hypothetical protein
MNIEASSIHASPVSQPDVPHVSAPPLDIRRVSHHAMPVIMMAAVAFAVFESALNLNRGNGNHVCHRVPRPRPGG